MELRLTLLQLLGDIGHLQSMHRIGSILLAALVVFIACVPWMRSGERLPPVRGYFAHPASFFLAIAALIFWARLPGLLPPMLNPDEGLFTAAAVRLLQDPLFWKSVDTGSSGPLNIVVLMWPGLLGWVPDLASSRLTGLTLVIVSTSLFYATLGRLYDEGVARIATLPVVMTFAFMQIPDFVHYSGEHGPILLLSIMLYVIARTYVQREDAPVNGLAFLVGLLAGLMPFTKLQGLPIAFALYLVFLHVLWSRRKASAGHAARALGCSVLGGVLPAAVVALYLTAFALWEPFLRSYLQTNLLFYADFNALGKPSKLANFVGLMIGTTHLYVLTILTSLFLVPAAWLALKRGSASGSKVWIGYAVPYLLFSVAAVARPGNPFPHYLLFLIMPMGLMLGTTLGAANASAAAQGLLRPVPFGRRPLLLTLALLLGSGLIVADRIRLGNDFLPRHKRYLDNFRGPIAQAIRRAAPPGSNLAVWGFSLDLYSESGMVQSNRYGTTLWQIEKNPLQTYFLREFMADIEQSQSVLFVDAMVPGMFYMGPIDPALHGHDAFPELARYVEAHYELIDTVRGVRIYRRKMPSVHSRIHKASEGKSQAAAQA